MHKGTAFCRNVQIDDAMSEQFKAIQNNAKPVENHRKQTECCIYRKKVVTLRA